MAEMTLTVNDVLYQVEVDTDMPLLWVLRDVLHLTGTKYSCGEGQCGACTIHLDGEARRACITSVDRAARAEITTIEGLSEQDNHPLQRTWQAENVAQCGYCQPGQLMAAAALLAAHPQPSDEQIDQALAGNLCRCGTYQRIRRAIHRAAREGGKS